jgi:hypothetical protein
MSFIEVDSAEPATAAGLRGKKRIIAITHIVSIVGGPKGSSVVSMSNGETVTVAIPYDELKQKVTKIEAEKRCTRNYL